MRLSLCFNQIDIELFHSNLKLRIKQNIGCFHRPIPAFISLRVICNLYFAFFCNYCTQMSFRNSPKAYISYVNTLHLFKGCPQFNLDISLKMIAASQKSEVN